MARTNVAKSLVGSVGYFTCALAAVLIPTIALAHPHHSGEFGLAHRVMHAVGWDGHSAPWVMGALWALDIAVLLIGGRMLLKASNGAGNSTALGRAFCAVGVVGASLLLIASA